VLNTGLWNPPDRDARFERLRGTGPGHLEVGTGAAVVVTDDAQGAAEGLAAVDRYLTPAQIRSWVKPGDLVVAPFAISDGTCVHCRAGLIYPGRVFDLELPLADVAEAYRAMDERRAVKVLLRP
jgi:hypothetical protein